jgi:hypothetical protein
MWLTPPSANLDVMGKACLSSCRLVYDALWVFCCGEDSTHSHSGMESSCNLVILLQPWTTT